MNYLYYRTISLISHVSKVLLRVIVNRIRIKTDELAIEQAGFQKESWNM